MEGVFAKFAGNGSLSSGRQLGRGGSGRYVAAQSAPCPPIVNNNVILRVAKGNGGIVVHMMSIANLIKIFKYKFVAFLFGAAGWGLHARRQTSNGGSARKKKHS